MCRECLKEFQAAIGSLRGIPYEIVARGDVVGRLQDFSANIVKQLGPDYQRLSDVAVGGLPIREFNATALAVRRKHRIVVLNWGLLDILTGLALEFVNAATSSKDLTKRLTKIVVKSAEAIVLRVPTKQIEESDPRWISRPEKQEHPWKKLDIRTFVKATVDAQISFVLCHEFAHIILKHVPSSVLSLISGLSKFVFAQQQESEADQKAATDLPSLYGDDFATQFATAAVYSLFRLMDVSERIERSPIFNAPEEPSSHPPALERWKNIEAILGAHRNEIAEFLYKRYKRPYDYAVQAVEIGNKKAWQDIGF